jgi:hypothetical protein
VIDTAAQNVMGIYNVPEKKDGRPDKIKKQNYFVCVNLFIFIV